MPAPKLSIKIVWFPPGEKHWHGATATTSLIHIAIQEKLDGKSVDWLEKVSDEHIADPYHKEVIMDEKRQYF